jgi:hypothetical protein
MRKPPYPDQVRWFEHLGTCSCGKPATGTMRGSGNESYGTYCERCAIKRLTRAVHQRALYDKWKATQTPATPTTSLDPDRQENTCAPNF